jgi:hypothetical protein
MTQPWPLIFCANSLLRSEGWRGRSTSGSWALLIPLHQLILCSGAFFPPVAFDCLGLPPACGVAEYGHCDVKEAEAELCCGHDVAFPIAARVC